MDRSLPGSSVHGIFQARVLEWGAITFSVNIHIWYNFTFLCLKVLKWFFLCLISYFHFPLSNLLFFLCSTFHICFLKPLVTVRYTLKL